MLESDKKRGAYGMKTEIVLQDICKNYGKSKR